MSSINNGTLNEEQEQIIVGYIYVEINSTKKNITIKLLTKLVILHCSIVKIMNKSTGEQQIYFLELLSSVNKSFTTNSSKKTAKKVPTKKSRN